MPGDWIHSKKKLSNGETEINKGRPRVVKVTSKRDN
jgi:hypothetical protein